MDIDLYMNAAKGEIELINKIAKAELGRMVTGSKRTVLHVNIESQGVSTKFVQWILDMCPSLLQQVNAQGDAPLHVAAKCGHPAVVEVLIEFPKKQTKDVETGVQTVRQMLGMTNEKRNTALHEAVRCCSIDVVKILMKTEPNFPYSTNGSGQTPLYLAAAKGSIEMIAVILENCPSAAHEGPSGKNALHAAVKSRARDVIKLLLEKKKSLSGEKDQHGWTPLHHAAYLGYDDITSMLLKSGESIAFLRDKDQKMTALHLAACQGYTRVVTEIICHSPVCYNLTDDRGWNVLHFAMVSFGYRELKGLLNEYPILNNLMNENDVKGNTPLHVLAAVRQDSTYQFIPLESKGDYEAINNKNISVESIINLHCGYPPLEHEIQELSKYVGTGRQYFKGVISIRGPDPVVLQKEDDTDESQKKDDTDESQKKDDTDESQKKDDTDESHKKDDADESHKKNGTDESRKKDDIDESQKKEDVDKYDKVRASHLVVAALIATVAFVAAFTIPGVYKSENGIAILRRNSAFQAFIISDTITMVLSLSAVFIHFLTSMDSKQKYPSLFVAATWFTMISMAAMVIAFVTGLYAMLAPSSSSEVCISRLCSPCHPLHLNNNASER